MLTFVAIGFALACSGSDPTSVQKSPLQGLTKVGSNDSGSTTPTPSGPGYIRGTVMAPSAPGSGGDTLSTALRIPNVKVTIYPRVTSGADTVAAGPEAGSVFTDANGLFQLPTLPAGEYIVTFVPPADSPYQGVYAFGPLHERSSDWPWWVILPRRN